VRQYIEERIANPATAADQADWICIRDLSTLASYDLEHETKLFYPRLRDHKLELEALLRRAEAYHSDFNGVDLDRLFGGEEL
jgi:hypothetical protein